MKLVFECFNCQINSSVPEPRVAGSDEWKFNSSIVESGIYQFICPNEHLNVVIYDTEKYELLFEYAVESIRQGSYKDGISTLSSCLERLYEYFIRLAFASEKKDLIQESWKLISNQSERQLGGFILLYCYLFDTNAPVLKSNIVELRNKIIHKGIFPTYEEVIQYGQACLDIIDTILLAISDRFEKEIKLLRSQRLEMLRSEALGISDNLITWIPSTQIGFRRVESGYMEDFNFKDTIESEFI